MMRAAYLHLPLLLATAVASFAPPPSLIHPHRASTETVYSEVTPGIPSFRNFRARPTTTTALRVANQRWQGAHWKGSKDLYAILGVSHNAAAEEIKNAYRRMVKRYHPDANRDVDTTEQFQDVNFAYHALIDPYQKKMYDEFCKATVGTRAKKSRGGTAAGSERNAAAGGSQSPSRRRKGFRRDVDFGDESDDFAEGRKARGGGSRGEPERPHHHVGSPYLSLDLEIDSETADFGGEEEVRIRRLETCRECHGTGTLSKRCDFCGGSGSRVQADWWGTENVNPCSKCHGTGRILEDCGSCDGRGRTEETKRVRVVVPPGVRDGNVLRVCGGGDSSPNGGPHHGDLYVFLRVKGGGDEDRNLAGHDIRLDLEIDERTARNGGEETVHFARLETCVDCDGSGQKPATWCHACHGSGMAGFAERSLQYDFHTFQPCEVCGGTGLHNAEDCETCSGKGRILSNKEIRVAIPPGIVDGDNIRVHGAGDSGRHGNPAGDLYVFLKVKRDVRAEEDERLHRNGSKAHSDPSIPKQTPDDWVVIPRDKHDKLDPDF